MQGCRARRWVLFLQMDRPDLDRLQVAGLWGLGCGEQNLLEAYFHGGLASGQPGPPRHPCFGVMLPLAGHRDCNRLGQGLCGQFRK